MSRSLSPPPRSQFLLISNYIQHILIKSVFFKMIYCWQMMNWVIAWFVTNQLRTVKVKSNIQSIVEGIPRGIYFAITGMLAVPMQHTRFDFWRSIMNVAHFWVPMDTLPPLKSQNCQRPYGFSCKKESSNWEMAAWASAKPNLRATRSLCNFRRMNC